MKWVPVSQLSGLSIGVQSILSYCTCKKIRIFLPIPEPAWWATAGAGGWGWLERPGRRDRPRRWPAPPISWGRSPARPPADAAPAHQPCTHQINNLTSGKIVSKIYSSALPTYQISNYRWHFYSSYVEETIKKYQNLNKALWCTHLYTIQWTTTPIALRKKGTVRSKRRTGQKNRGPGGVDDVKRHVGEVGEEVEVGLGPAATTVHREALLLGKLQQQQLHILHCCLVDMRACYLPRYLP